MCQTRLMWLMIYFSYALPLVYEKHRKATTINYKKKNKMAASFSQKLKVKIT